MNTELRKTAIKLHHVHHIIRRDSKTAEQCAKYIKSNCFDNDTKLLKNRQLAVSAVNELLDIERELSYELQSEVKNSINQIRSYADDGFMRIFYTVGAIVSMAWDLVAGAFFGV